MKRKVLILGGGYAGLIACNRLVKLDKNLAITLINDGHLFVERIRNHEKATGKKKKDLQLRELIHKRVDFLNAKVAKIDPETREVTVENSDTKLKYDALVYALGSTKLSLRNQMASVVTKESSESLFKNLQERTEGSVWMLGGGLTGIELATEWRETYPHWKVGIVNRGKFASSFSVKGQEYLKMICNDMQIEIQEETEVASFQEEQIRFKNGSTAVCHLLVDTSGFSSSKVATHSGFRTNEKNQILINRFLQVPEYPTVFVAGDACYMENSNLRMGCVTALPLGVHAAENVYKSLKNEKLEEFRFSFMGRCVSLGRKNGLIQMTDERDNPKETIITGKLGAFLKELICKYTLLSIRLEKCFPFRTYQWPKTKAEKKSQRLEKSYE